MQCGCGPPEPDQKLEASRLELAQNLRSYYNKANGDYSQLSAADKAAFVKLSGSEAKGQENWNLMKNGPGAANRAAPEPPATTAGR